MKIPQPTRLTTSWVKSLAFVLPLCLFLITCSPGPAFAALPATSTPKILITPEQEAVWAKMKADYEANPASPATLGGKLYKQFKLDAECACRYADNLTASIMYHITGDPVYIPLAWKALSGFLSLEPTEHGRFSREQFIQFVTIYDWIYPGLTSAQRQQLFDKINEMASYVASVNARTYDSDQSVGDYFGLALWYHLTKDYNPTIVTIWNRPIVGGLTPTGADLSTYRNAINYYVTKLAKGGEWIESSEYNTGTNVLLLMGWHGMRTLTGTDYFPEIAAYVSQLAADRIMMTTNDLKQPIQWGDEEHPRNFGGRLFYINRINAVAAGLTKGTAVGPAIQDLTIDIIEQYPPLGGLVGGLAARYMYFFDPYAPRGDRRSVSKTWFAAGQQMMTVRDDWGPNDTVLWVHFPPPPGVDHMLDNFANFQLYRKGEFAITHPIAYSSLTALEGEVLNSMEFMNFPVATVFHAPKEFKKVTAQEFGPGGSYAYIVGTEGGQTHISGGYIPPETFIHEWTRSMLYLPSTDKKSDTIVIYDRTHIKDPRLLARYNGYPVKVREAFDAAVARKNWFIHAKTAPTVTAETISWSTPMNQLKVSTLLPKGQRKTVVDEAVRFPTASVAASEKKFYVRIDPPTDQDWDTFLNVVQAYDSGAVLNNTLVKSTLGEAEGVLVKRAGHTDVLAVFNSKKGQDLPAPHNPYNPLTQQILANIHFAPNGYTISWTAGTPQTQAYLADLNPAGDWAVRIDGGTQSPLVPSSQGLAQLTVNGAGSHTLQVILINAPPPLPPPPPYTQPPTLPPSNQPPAGVLPLPDLSNFPSTIRLNESLIITAPVYTNVSFRWNFTPVSGNISDSAAPSTASPAPVVSFMSASRTEALANYGLKPGSYQIQVQAVDNANKTRVSSTASKTIALVTADLSDIRVYPNPWRSDRNSGMIIFDRLPLGSTVKIFTLSGHWLKTITSASGTAQWDLTNDKGNKVAAGIYLYLVTADGQKKTGKLVVIR